MTVTVTVRKESIKMAMAGEGTVTVSTERSRRALLLAGPVEFTGPPGPAAVRGPAYTRFTVTESIIAYGNYAG